MQTGAGHAWARNDHHELEPEEAVIHAVDTNQDTTTLTLKCAVRGALTQ